MNAMYVQLLVKLQICLLFNIWRTFIRYIFTSICIFFLTFVLIMCLRTKYEEENNRIKYGDQVHPKNYDEAYMDEEELRFSKTRGKYLRVDKSPDTDEQMPLLKKSLFSRNMYDIARGKMKFVDYEPNEDSLPHFLLIKRSPMGMLGQIQANDSTWQQVSNGYLAFSAFYDRRIPSQPFIRIIAAANVPIMPTWCRLWFNISDQNEWHFQYVKAVLTEEDSKRKNYYRSIFVTCPLVQLTVPDFVSLMTRNELEPYNTLVIRNSAISQEPRKIPYADTNEVQSTESFTTLAMDKVYIPHPMVLCVKLPHLADKKVMNLMELLEIYSTIGVQHFFLYTTPRIEVETKCLLSNYSTITLLPWVVSSMYGDNMAFEAKDSADNDCVYRAMYTYTYAVLVDMNEFIFPRKHDTLLSLLENQVSQEKSALVSSFLFPKATFCLRWEKDDHFESLHADLVQDALRTFARTRRNKYLKENKEYIIVPDKISSAASGFYTTVSSLNEKVIVPSKLAMLQQYTSDEDSCRAKKIVVDKTIYKFGRVLPAVWKRYSKINCSKVFNYYLYFNSILKSNANISDEFV